MKSDNEPDLSKILDELYSGKDISKYYPKKVKNPLTIPLEHAELTVAAFYSQREKLEGKLNNEISFSGNGFDYDGFDFVITPRDILIMHRDALFEIAKKTQKYKQALETLRYFDIPEDSEIDYYKFLTAYFYIGDDDWVDESERSEYLVAGFKDIDIDLINCGVKCQLEKVKELLKKGANIYTTIDPHSKSDLLDHVCTDASLSGIQYSGLLKYKPAKIKLMDKNIHHMLNSLVATASCTRMYKCLMGYE